MVIRRSNPPAVYRRWFAAASAVTFVTEPSSTPGGSDAIAETGSRSLEPDIDGVGVGVGVAVGVAVAVGPAVGVAVGAAVAVGVPSVASVGVAPPSPSDTSPGVAVDPPPPMIEHPESVTSATTASIATVRPIRVA
jgi:hypothetical protein